MRDLFPYGKGGMPSGVLFAPKRQRRQLPRLSRCSQKEEVAPLNRGDLVTKKGEKTLLQESKGTRSSKRSKRRKEKSLLPCPKNPISWEGQLYSNVNNTSSYSRKLLERKFVQIVNKSEALGFKIHRRITTTGPYFILPFGSKQPKYSYAISRNSKSLTDLQCYYNKLSVTESVKRFKDITSSSEFKQKKRQIPTKVQANIRPDLLRIDTYSITLNVKSKANLGRIGSFIYSSLRKKPKESILKDFNFSRQEISSLSESITDRLLINSVFRTDKLPIRLLRYCNYLSGGLFQLVRRPVKSVRVDLIRRLLRWNSTVCLPQLLMEMKSRILRLRAQDLVS